MVARGKAVCGEKFVVSFLGKSYETTADAVGRWRLNMDAVKKGGPHQLLVKAGNEVRIGDVLIGEV